MTNVNIVWDEYLSLDIPVEWEYQEENGTISIYNPEGVGAIQISFAGTNDMVSEIDPAEFVIYFAQSLGFNNVEPTPVILNGLQSSYFEGIDNDIEPSLWRIWSAGRNSRVATISYTCDKHEHTVEKEDVDKIIASIIWLF